MPNFDALRSAISGPLSYLCQPAPPVELICCYPFTSKIDPSGKSSIAVNGDIQASSMAWFNKGLYATGNLSASIEFSQTLNMALPWSIEFLLANNTNQKVASGIKLEMGNLTFQSSGYYIQLIVRNGETQLYNGYSTEGPQQTAYALVYDGSKLRYFVQGSVVQTFTTAFAGNINSVAWITTNYGSNLPYVTNFRIVQKALGTNSSYPLPTGLYTGYEPL